MKWKLRYFTFFLFFFIFLFFSSSIHVNAQTITPTVTLKNYNNTTVLLSGYTNYNPNANEFYVGKVEFPFSNYTLNSNTIYSFSMTYDFFVDEFGDNGNFGYQTPELYLLSSNGLTLQSGTIQNFNNYLVSGSCINLICTYRLNFSFSFTASKSGTIYLAIPLDVPYIVHGFQYVSADVTSYGQNQNNSDIINNNNQNTQNIINNNNQNTQQIINSQNETTEAIENLNDTLQDTNINGSSIASGFADIDTISDTPITDLLTLPLILLNKINNSIGTSCSPYTLPFNLWGNGNYTITLPCFNGSTYFGNVWSVIDALFSFFMIYNIGMMVVQFFEKLTSLHDTFDDTYIPQHAKGGGN